jgi:hypothetical protein
MTGDRFTVMYGEDGGQHYTHVVRPTLDAAKEAADSWKAGEAHGVISSEKLRVWVEDSQGKVVYGQVAALWVMRTPRKL